MHYPGHLRAAFERWLEAGCPPTATVEVNYEPEEWSARKLLGRMAHCTDVMPRMVCGLIDVQPGTSYAAAAQRLLRESRSTAA